MRATKYVGLTCVLFFFAVSTHSIELKSSLFTGPVEVLRSSAGALEQASIGNLDLFAFGIFSNDFHLPFLRGLGMAYKVGPLQLGMHYVDTDALQDVISFSSYRNLSAHLDFRLEEQIFSGRFFLAILPLPNVRVKVEGQAPIDVSKLGAWAAMAEFKVDFLRFNAAYARIEGDAAVAGLVPIGAFNASLWAATVSAPFGGIGILGLEINGGARSPDGLLGSFLDNTFSSRLSAQLLGPVAWISLEVPLQGLTIGLDTFGGVLWSLGYTQEWQNVKRTLVGGSFFAPIYSYTTTGSNFYLSEDPAWVLVLHPKIDIKIDDGISFEISRWIPLFHFWQSDEKSFGPAGPTVSPSPPLPPGHEFDPAFMILFAGWQVTLKYSIP